MTELDLTPNTPEEPTRSRHRIRNWLVVGTIVAVLGFVMFKAITSATVFYINVDEAVAQRTELGDDTFRLQGVVVAEPEVDANGAITFPVEFGGVTTTVRHVGEEPSELFEVGIPIVAEGHWEADAFESRQLLVKHSESYEADNPDRVDYELDDAIE